VVNFNTYTSRRLALKATFKQRTLSCNLPPARLKHSTPLKELLPAGAPQSMEACGKRYRELLQGLGSGALRVDTSIPKA